MRVALVHDWLTGMRGGERVLHELATLYPDADLYTLVHVEGSTTPAIEERQIHTSPLSRLPGAHVHYRKLLPLFPWAIQRFQLRGYDLVISCSHAVAKGVRTPAGTRHLAYCLTPMRYIWDEVDNYVGRGPRRLLAWPLIQYLRDFDRRTSSAARVDRFVAISSEVSRRIQRYYDRESPIVYPPVDVDRIRPSGKPPEDFYLLVGGFVPYKREDVAIEAFRRLGRRLVVAGDGPLRERLSRDAPPWIEFTGRLTDDELADLYARCRALVYPQKEDFGIVAVEAQAAGRPVIAYGRGGTLDTVVSLDDEGTEGCATGLRFPSQTPEALCRAVLRFEEVEGAFDPERIRSWARRFDVQHFREGFQRQVRELCGGGQTRAIGAPGVAT